MRGVFASRGSFLISCLSRARVCAMKVLVQTLTGKTTWEVTVGEEDTIAEMKTQVQGREVSRAVDARECCSCVTALHRASSQRSSVICTRARRWTTPRQ